MSSCSRRLSSARIRCLPLLSVEPPPPASEPTEATSCACSSTDDAVSDAILHCRLTHITNPCSESAHRSEGWCFRELGEKEFSYRFDFSPSRPYIPSNKLSPTQKKKKTYINIWTFNLILLSHFPVCPSDFSFDNETFSVYFF